LQYLQFAHVLLSRMPMNHGEHVRYALVDTSSKMAVVRSDQFVWHYVSLDSASRKKSYSGI